MKERSVNAATAVRVRDQLQRLMPGWQTGQIRVFEFLSGGYSNDNYRFSYDGEDYVIRLPSRTRSFIDRRLERAFYEEHAVQFPIPDLIALEEATGNLLTRYIPGPLLADEPPALESIAAYLRSLHAALPPSSRQYDPYALSREYLASGDAPVPIRKLADGPWEPKVLATCHNDLNPWNVIRTTSNRWVTLDWEWLGRNDPLFDLVTLHQGMGLPEPSLETLVSLWQESPVEPGRLESCLIAFWLREFSWAWSERHHGNTRDEIEAQIRISREKLAALLS